MDGIPQCSSVVFTCGILVGVEMLMKVGHLLGNKLG